jgi:predicted RNA-binding Zn ribbon-like protein
MVKCGDMDPIPLDPAGYDGTYKLIGGEVSFDLVNTISWPDSEREHDWFDPATNITHWAREVGIIDTRGARTLEKGLRLRPGRWKSQAREVHAIRERLSLVLRPLAGQERPSRGDVTEFNALLAFASRRRQIDPAGLGWSWAPTSDLVDMMAPVVWNAAEILAQPDHSRIRACAGCDWLFHDLSRNNNRRWCDMSDCGSRDKALRYYYRHKAR